MPTVTLVSDRGENRVVDDLIELEALVLRGPWKPATGTYAEAVTALTGQAPVVTPSNPIGGGLDRGVAGLLNLPGSETWAAGRAAFAPRRVALTNPAGLTKWFAALGARRTSPVSVLVEGNSNWEGTGAADFSQRVPVVLNAELRARYGLGGAANPYITRSFITPVPTNPPFTIAGTVSGAQFGLGSRGWSIAENGGTITVPFTGDRVRVNYTRSGGSGIITLVLDGGAPITINTVNGSQIAARWDSGALTRGPHTLVISRDPASVSSRNIFINGVETYDGDFTTGIRVYDAGKHGVLASALANAESAEFVQAGPFGVIVIGTGENDTALTADAYRTVVEGVLGRYRAMGHAGSFLLCHGPRPGGYDATQWDAFGAAEQQIALASTDVAALDLSVSVPAYDTGGQALGLYADSKHNTSAGQAWRVDMVRAALAPA